MNSLESGRLHREQLTMQRMVEIYCFANHGAPRGQVCQDCGVFISYADKRLEKCPYGEDKPACGSCPVHCYKREQRARAQRIMRYSGPRMLWKHPWLTLLHMMDKRRKVLPPMELRRQRDSQEQAPR